MPDSQDSSADSANNLQDGFTKSHILIQKTDGYFSSYHNEIKKQEQPAITRIRVSLSTYPKPDSLELVDSNRPYAAIRRQV
jgi:hypothetical protein